MDKLIKLIKKKIKIAKKSNFKKIYMAITTDEAQMIIKALSKAFKEVKNE